MLLFKPEHVEPILMGTKVQTRRRWPRGPRARVGALHQCRTRMLRKDAIFAVVRITSLRREELGAITEEDARREGYPSREAYFDVWGRIYADAKRCDHELVYVVDFELAKVPCFGCGGSTVARFHDGTTDACWLCKDGFVDVTDRSRTAAVERRRRELTGAS